ncbi:uncharacterized protein LOC128726844 [Anopheles nili]|uniref:uncharacterized protein LOC128726844 n=1 Tax=Anopheles nili TaxID=185578 RepID=UPI00237AFFF2|nr:uncharacterized protein LOC128726844 [Anopheles nili]
MYRKSSSPARQGPTGGSGGRGVGRYAKANRSPAANGMSSLPRPLNSRTGGELRRSSAAGLNVVSQRPPLPPKIELRSHSYDGLLDDPVVSQRMPRKAPIGTTTTTPVVVVAYRGARTATEGHDHADGADERTTTGGETSTRRSHAGKKIDGTTSEALMKSKNRRSRSMDDLFDDDGGAPGVECDFLDNTQSMETLLASGPVTPTDCGPDSPPILGLGGGGNICLNRRFISDDERQRGLEDSQDSRSTSQEQLCEKETITVDSTAPRTLDDGQDDGLVQEKPRDGNDEEEDDQSTHSSVASSLGSSSTAGEKAAPKKAPKPLINRYVKKVKSLMKM